MILLDTNAFLWWLSSHEKLSNPVQKAINLESKNQKLLVSSISIWEISLLVNKNRLSIGRPLEEWVTGLKDLEEIEFIPIDNSIAYKSTCLPGKFHADPADRLVVATARHLGATLITSDKLIRKYKHVKTLW